MTDYSIKLSLTRDQRRRVNRAASKAGLRPGPWVRLVVLGALGVEEGPIVAGEVKVAQAVNLQPSGPIVPRGINAVTSVGVRAKLIGTYDPDQTP